MELEAGDALYLPKLWWHKVESLAPLNGLVNYWWDAFSAGPDAPYTSMLLAMIAIAERPVAERAGVEGVLRSLCLPHQRASARASAAGAAWAPWAVEAGELRAHPRPHHAHAAGGLKAP